MHVVADTTKLVSDGIITDQAAREIETRGREAMVSLAINAVLCFGIISATLGLIFWLSDAVTVALVGFALLALGLGLLARMGDTFAMFGNAAALIGAGMLLGGAGLELSMQYGRAGLTIMALGGALVALIAARSVVKGGLTSPFIAGSIMIMGVVLHLWGMAALFEDFKIDGIWRAFGFLYAALVVGFSGWVVDVRLITALAVVPFAQVLDTGTSYFHAVYVFYSPEPTLSILQMAVLITALVWGMRRTDERHARHFGILAILAFVVANLSALVATLWGDVVGQSLWGPGHWYSRSEGFEKYADWRSAREAFEAQAFVISSNTYVVLWAVALAALVLWFAYRAQRGLFNTAITFAAIHAYTQLFENFGDQPLAFVVGGFAAIPLAWGIWRLNQAMKPSP